MAGCNHTILKLEIVKSKKLKCKRNTKREKERVIKSHLTNRCKRNNNTHTLKVTRLIKRIINNNTHTLKVT